MFSGNDSIATINDSENDTTAILYHITVIYLPLLIIVGLIGNLSSIAIICGSSRLRHHPPNPYLAYLCVSDTAFLCSLIVVWLRIVHVDQYMSLFVCRLHIFVMNCSSWMSSWIITALSIERFIVLTDRRNNIFARRRETLIVLAMFPAPVLFNCFVVSWIGIVDEAVSGGNYCGFMPQYQRYALIANAIDTAIVLIVPLTITLIANRSVFWRLLWLHRTTPLGHVLVPGSTNNDPNEATSPSSPMRRHISQPLLVRQRRQMARILILVPAVYILLNLPSYTLRIMHHFYFFDHDDNVIPVAITDVAYLLSYANSAINFIVYCMASRHFRKIPLRLFRSKFACCRINRQNRNLSIHHHIDEQPPDDHQQQPNIMMLVTESSAPPPTVDDIPIVYTTTFDISAKITSVSRL